MKQLFNFIFIILILSSCQNNSRDNRKSSVTDTDKIITGQKHFKKSITMTADTSSINKQKLSKDVFKLDVDSTYYILVDEQAKFQNGDLNNFRKYFDKKLIMPVIPDSLLIFGKIIFSFDIDWNGKLKNIKILRSPGFKPLDEKIIKILQSSPEWVPAILNGKRVGQSIVIPMNIDFQ
jgi:TonB family protein